MSRVFAYCRVSTLDQDTQNQVLEIQAAGFNVQRQRIIEEKVSGSVPAQERKTSLVDRLNRPTQLIDRQGWPTQLLPQTAQAASTLLLSRQANDDLALGYERGTDLLFRQANSLATVSWPGGWPLALLNLRTHIADCDRVEAELSEQLVAIEKHHREHQQVQERHQQLPSWLGPLEERQRRQH